jgi:ABC-type uncharacterized transport system auxiliary subunit
MRRIALLIAVAGCSIVPKAPPQAYYDLEYETEQVPCDRSYSSPVEVWEFTAAAPYDRPDMVVTQGREVMPSPGHHWVDRAGALVASKLIRDFNSGNLFPLAVSPRAAHGSPLELTGNVYQFAWVKEGNSARARFEVDVVLRKPGEILLHKRYDLKSDPMSASDDAALFARAMSGVVRRFSTSLRRDLCEVVSR